MSIASHQVALSPQPALFVGPRSDQTAHREKADHFLTFLRRAITAMKAHAIGTLTPQQVWILFDLFEQPLSMSAIAQVRKVTPGTATALVARLASRGLVEREHPETNRRLIIISLTPTGRAMVRRIHRKLERIFTLEKSRVGMQDQGQAVERLVSSLEGIFPYEDPVGASTRLGLNGGGRNRAPGAPRPRALGPELPRLGMRIGRVMRSVSREFKEIQGLPDVRPLNMDQTWILRELLFGPVSVGQVTSFRRVSYMTAMELVARLAARGLVERVQANGRKRIVVQLTPAGREVATHIYEGMRGIIVKNTSPFTPERQEQLQQAVALLEPLFPEESPPWRRGMTR